jgi:hypothetical protein
MNEQKEKIVGIILIVILFLVMVSAIAFVLIKNPAPEKNDINDFNKPFTPYSPPTRENKIIPPSNPSEKSMPSAITNTVPQTTNPSVKEPSQAKISNPEGSSLLKAEYLDCGNSEIVLKNTSGRTDEMNYHITASLTAKINDIPMTVECLDDSGGYHIRSGQTCKIKLGRKIWKGDSISLYEGYQQNLITIFDKVTCN